MLWFFNKIAWRQRAFVNGLCYLCRAIKLPDHVIAQQSEPGGVKGSYNG